MLSLNDRDWSVFSISDLFEEVQPTKGVDTGKLIVGDDVPYIAAAKDNNGYKGMFSSAEYPEWVSKGNGIVVVQLGDGAAGLAWYVPMDFIGMKGKTSVCYNKYLNKYNGVFIARVMSMNKERFSHGYSWTGNRLLSTKISLPVSADGKPDYDFMEAYIAQVEDGKYAEYIAYCKEQLAELGDPVDIESISERDWHEFFISEFMNIPKRGKRITSDKYVDGGMPVVSSAGGNNGVIAFAGNTEKVRIYERCLSVANGGVSAGFAFYHSYRFIATDHVTHFKGDSLNKYHYLFLSTIIRNQMHDKYDFSREMTDSRLEREKLLVPVTSEGEPDYDYMEQYTKNLMIKKYQQYLKFLKK